MVTLNSPEIAQATLLRWKRDGQVSFVPTMGSLHEGHLRLIRLAKSVADRVVVSIFVNPLQFGPTEDLAQYPRPFEGDRALLEKEKVDLLFAPKETDLYPKGFQTRVRVGELARHLCGASRPGHFEGVATVCLKLFEITRADIAVFGEKDFQQLRIIRQLVADLNLPVSILSHTIVREEDGLALSSRNRYLTPCERSDAARLFESLTTAKAQATDRSVTAGRLLETMHRNLHETFDIDYKSICSESTLVPVAPHCRVGDITQPRLFVAAKIGQTRLIDNIAL